MSSIVGYCCDRADEPPMPLTLAEAGCPLRVAAVRGGCGAAGRLAELGLTAGAVFEVIQPSLGGPVMILLRGGRLAIGRGLADKIIVQPLTAGAGPVTLPA